MGTNGDISVKRNDDDMMEKKKIVLIAYLFMFFLGASWSSVGVVVGGIAVNLGVSVSTVIASFTLFTISCTIMVFATTGVLLEFFSLKKVSILAILLLFAGIGIILIAKNMLLLNVALFTYGIGYGMSFSLGYYYVVYITDNKSRASKMAIMSLMYSVGAAVAPKISGYMLNQGISWNIALSCYTVVMLIALIVAINTKFRLGSEKKGQVKINEPKLKAGKTWIEEIVSWPLTVYLMGFALFSYVVAETVLVFWLVIFGNKGMGMTLEGASSLPAIFWTSVIVGRFMAGYVLKIITQELYICIICTVSGILLLMLSILSLSPIFAYSLVAVLGIGFAAAYSTIASTGTTQMPHATTRLTTAILGAGAIGTVAAPLISSYIESVAGVKNVFIFCGLFMLLITLLMIIVQIVNKARGYDTQKV